MPGYTPNYSFPYPLGTDPVRDGDDVIQQFADQVDLELVNLNSVLAGYGVLVRTPSSVGGTGVSLVGAKIVVSGATSIQVNGVFGGSGFDSFTIRARLAGSLSDTFFRLSSGGTPAVGTNYAWSMLQGYQGAGGGNVQSTRTNGATSIPFTSNPNGGYWGSAVVDIFRPQFLEPTGYQNTHTRHDGSYGTPANYQFFGNHNLNQNYDGFNIFCTAGSMTGQLTVYAWKN